MIRRASGDSGMRCSRPFFARLAGKVHTPRSKSISRVCRPKTSALRCPVASIRRRMRRTFGSIGGVLSRTRQRSPISSSLSARSR